MERLLYARPLYLLSRHCKRESQSEAPQKSKHQRQKSKVLLLLLLANVLSARWRYW